MKAILHGETINQTKSFGTTSICIQARIQDEDRARKRGPSPYKHDEMVPKLANF